MAVSAAKRPRYKARVAPRGGSGRGAASRIHWDKVGRVALVLVLFAVLGSYVKPVANVISTWQEAGTAEQRLVELKAENKRLEARAAELKTPAGAMREARKLGLVAPGEQAYVVKGLK